MGERVATHPDDFSHAPDVFRVGRTATVSRVISCMRTVRLSAAILALALLGDALLYVVLPIEAHQFGVSAASVGLLLSVNRLVRLVGYGAITTLAGRLGPRRLTMLAAVAAALSTTGYAFARGLAPMLALRLVWGLAFAALSLTTIMYAVADGERAGHRLGVSRALTALGPLIALTVGPLVAIQWSSKTVFLIFGGAATVSVFLATTLPRTHADVAGAANSTAPSRWGYLGRRSFLTWWSLTIGFAVDGVFAVSFALLVAKMVSINTAIVSAGLVLAARYATEVAFAPVAGRLADRLSAERLLVACSVVVACGFLVLAAGASSAATDTLGMSGDLLPGRVPAAVWLGATIVVAARGFLLPLGPAAQAIRHQHHGHNGSLRSKHQAQADLAAWRDTGATFGPLAAGWAVGVVPSATVYSVLAVLLLGVLGVRGRTWPSASIPQRLHLSE